jgi:hypothetical protein
MKIQLDKVVVTAVEIDIPEVCPRCGADFSDGYALEEQQLCFGSQVLDHTADTLLGSPYDQALWQLVGREAVEHTLDVPILFRIPGPRDE